MSEDDQAARQLAGGDRAEGFIGSHDVSLLADHAL